MLGGRNDPYLAFNFLVEVEGLTVAGFSEATGLHAEVEVEEYREGGVNEYIHRLRGPVRHPTNLVLKRGITDGWTLWRWFQPFASGMPSSLAQRRNGSIVLLDASGHETVRWNFVDAYPIKWTGPDLRANQVEVAVETLELIHDGISGPIG